MLRFYGFSVGEIMAGAGPDGALDLAVDPKLGWALARREQFPVDLNHAPKEMLLRVPGLGTKGVAAILKARRFGRLRLADLERISHSTAKMLPFVTLLDWHPGSLTDRIDLRQRIVSEQQLDLFAAQAA